MVGVNEQNLIKNIGGDPSLRKAPSEVERAWISDLQSERVKLRARMAISSPNGIGEWQVETSIPQGEPGKLTMALSNEGLTTP